MKKLVLLGLVAAVCLLLMGWTQQDAAPAFDGHSVEMSIDLPDVSDDLLPMGGCFMCSKSDSSGACKGAEQCKGTRKACRKKGCKITGTRSCSTAANVKTC